MKVCRKSLAVALTGIWFLQATVPMSALDMQSTLENHDPAQNAANAPSTTAGTGTGTGTATEDGQGSGQTGTVKVNSKLNIRSGPWGKIIGSFTNGAKLTITGRQGDWLKISYNGKTAYVHSKYVTIDGGSQTASSNAATSPGTSSTGSTGSTGTTRPTSPGTTPGATVTPNGNSAAANAKSMLSSGVITRGSKRFDGRLNFTQYGGPTDGTPDKYTQAGMGNRGNRLRATSLALSPDLIRKYGLRGGETISIKTSRGTFFLGHYDDTTGNKREPNVIDVYDPTDSLGRDSFMANVPAGQWELVIGR